MQGVIEKEDVIETFVSKISAVRVDRGNPGENVNFFQGRLSVFKSEHSVR